LDLEKIQWTKESGWKFDRSNKFSDSAHILLIFGAVSALKDGSLLSHLRKIYPSAIFFGCSSAGEVLGDKIYDDSLVAIAIKFKHTSFDYKFARFSDFKGGYDMGEHLANSFDKKNLRHIIVFSDAMNINASKFVDGIVDNLPENISLSGGLAGFLGDIAETYVIHDDRIKSGMVSALGLYGDKLKIGYGSRGGWDPFGPYRVITRSKGKVVYEFEGKPALDLYKRYLGDQAKYLPASALYFPIAIRESLSSRTAVIRAVFSVNEEDKSISFAGEVPEGYYAQLARASYDRMIDGAVEAAEVAKKALGSDKIDLAILVTCYARRMVLKQRTEEELEGVRDVFGSETPTIGFYSYGEISPFGPGERSELHNKTMTIVTIREQ